MRKPRVCRGKVVGERQVNMLTIPCNPYSSIRSRAVFWGGGIVFNRWRIKYIARRIYLGGNQFGMARHVLVQVLIGVDG